MKSRAGRIMSVTMFERRRASVSVPLLDRCGVGRPGRARRLLVMAFGSRQTKLHERVRMGQRRCLDIVLCEV